MIAPRSIRGDFDRARSTSRYRPKFRSEQSDRLRLFLAINLTPEVRRDVASATAALRDCVPELAWIREPRLHLTLKFLGEQPEGRVGEIGAAIMEVARRHREFVVTLGGMG